MAEKQTDNRYQVEKKLTELSRLSDEEILNLMKTDTEGINQVEASARLEEYGPNIIDSGNENNLFERVKEAIINPFNIGDYRICTCCNYQLIIFYKFNTTLC